MKRECVLCALLVLSGIAVEDLTAGKFTRGILRKSDWVTLNIPRPPDAYPPMKKVSVEIVEAEERFRDRTRLRLQIEQQVAQDFDVDAADPDAKLKIVVVAFDPPSVTYKTQVESRPIVVNKKTQIV